ncbi:MAG: LAGLIDADG family homing endonuclease [Candidatus Woesearchaeota archaeon]
MISAELAELAGIFAADGCMQKDYICLWGNIREDRPYYEGTITSLFEKEFHTTPKCHEKPSNSVYGFYICKRKIIQEFQKLGFHPGNKTYTVKVPEQIMTDRRPEIWASFIRGFFDGDGCLHFSKRKGTYSKFKREHHTYPRILITSRSFGLARQIYELLQRLGIHSTLTYKKPGTLRENPCAVITIRGIQMLENWMKIIGMSNNSSLTKYLLWKKQGFCPSYTSMKERIELMA